MDSSGGRILWTIAGITLIGLLALGLFFGPTLYREGRAVVGPIMDLAKSEEAFAELDLEMPFTAPDDDLVDEARLEVFLTIREELLPSYASFAEIERQLGPGDNESFEDAKVVLGAVREALNAQTELLRRHAMSPAEFRWLEERVYDNWLSALSEVDDWGNPALKAKLTEWVERDLAVVAEARRAGDSPSLDLVEQHLQRRHDELSGQRLPTVASIPEADEALFRRHAERIHALDLSEYDEIHDRFRQDPGNFSVNVNSGGDRSHADVDAEAPEH